MICTFTKCFGSAERAGWIVLTIGTLLATAMLGLGFYLVSVFQILVAMWMLLQNYDLYLALKGGPSTIAQHPMFANIIDNTTLRSQPEPIAIIPTWTAPTQFDRAPIHIASAAVVVHPVGVQRNSV